MHRVTIRASSEPCHDPHGLARPGSALSGSKRAERELLPSRAQGGFSQAWGIVILLLTSTWPLIGCRSASLPGTAWLGSADVVTVAERDLTRHDPTAGRVALKPKSPIRPAGWETEEQQDRGRSATSKEREQSTTERSADGPRPFPGEESPVLMTDYLQSLPVPPPPEDPEVPSGAASPANANGSAPKPGEAAGASTEPAVDIASLNELSNLIGMAVAANPQLARLRREANAAAAKTRYVDKLPDPVLGANIFGHPIETAAGSQRANLTFSQKIPWLERLDAQQQQAYYEAMALRQKYEAERLRVIGDLRANYFRLYVLARQIETVEANQELLETLIAIVTARVATGNATQGDVLLGTLELSRLEEQLISLRQQIRSTEAEINRLVNRPVNIAIDVPKRLKVPAPNWTHDLLVQTAFERQPVIEAARLQAHAARWGVSVAKLLRRPDLQLSAAWFFMDNNRPPSGIVRVGRDAWSLGLSVTIPFDRSKYDAIRDEALWKNAAAQSNIDDTLRTFDSRLLDLLAQARAASETADLFRDTIIPQSEQTLAADQESLTDGAVEFDRVIQDFRNLIILEFGYHRAVGQLATSIARIQQAVGIDLQPQGVLPAEPPPLPLPAEQDANGQNRPEPE